MTDILTYDGGYDFTFTPMLGPKAPGEIQSDWTPKFIHTMES